PVTPQQRGTAQQVAQAGVPLSELAPNAPDTYTVRRRDTLWDISKIFLRSPWRWPELWGMNLDQIRNPHLIYPGQVLYLDKSDGRARLRFGQPGSGTIKLSPRVRSSGLDDGAIATIPFHLIEPFLNQAVIFQSNELETAPRIVAAQEGRVLMGRGDVAYVRGDLSDQQREYRVFREPKPLTDPTTGEVLGFEANYVGTAEYTRPGDLRKVADGKAEIVPATFVLTTLRQEAGIGDRLAAVPPPEFSNYVPHAPQGAMAGQIVSVYGEGLNAGQNHIVSLNKGTRDGMERGHVLALWRDGTEVIDKTDPKRPTIKLPDERHGTLFVFRVFDRMSYALIMSVQEAVKRGDRFTQP
ncbi:MAG: LysM peptidoglycan-binding domain-containing protein, partial [Rhizobacter sp.]|nr:LysM peptidoglycan-binding domain-containing protein [Rhizobacter sp.]